MDDPAMLGCQIELLLSLLGSHLQQTQCPFEADSRGTLPQVATVEQGNSSAD